jgi:plastocyanin
MRTHGKTTTLAALAAASLGVMAPLGVFVIGCTKLDSGAHAEPSVRIKPAEELVAVTNDGGAKTDSSAGAATGEKGGTGTLTGRVVLKGNKPTQIVLTPKGGALQDPEVCAKDADILSEDLIVSDDNGVANVLVYLDKPPTGYKAEKPAKDVEFDQRGCVFTPHVLICQVGQTVRVMSDDPIAHNTHTFPIRNDPFNSTIKPKERTGIELVYKKPEKEPFQVKCDLHAWMRAYHLPLDHPFAAVSGKDGRFEIADLPAGNYEFKVWHESAGGKGGFLERKRKVSIKSGEPTPPVTINVEPSKFGL